MIWGRTGCCCIQISFVAYSKGSRALGALGFGFGIVGSGGSLDLSKHPEPGSSRSWAKAGCLDDGRGPCTLIASRRESRSYFLTEMTCYRSFWLSNVLFNVAEAHEMRATIYLRLVDINSARFDHLLKTRIDRWFGAMLRRIQKRIARPDMQTDSTSCRCGQSKFTIRYTPVSL